MYRIRKTKNMGYGVFTNKSFESESIIGKVCVKGAIPYITVGRLIYDGWCETHPLGRYINHSSEPNCNVIHNDNIINLVSNTAIKQDDELTMNYFDIAKIVNLPKETWEEHFYSEGIFDE